MTNRTIQFFGQASSAVAITANVQVNGNTVFTGEIITTNNPINVEPGAQIKIIEFELPLNTVGPAPVTILFTGEGRAYVEQVRSNYSVIGNPVYTQGEIEILVDPDTTQAEKLPIYESAANPPLTSQDILVLENGTPEQQALVIKEHNLQTTLISPGTFGALVVPQCKTNVVINGVARTPGDTPPGEWGWQIPTVDGTGTITFDMVLPAPLS